MRRRRRGRPHVIPRIGWIPEFREFHTHPLRGREAIEITPAELEALRLVDYEDRSFEEAAEAMGVSRGSVWRWVKSGRRKLIEALITAKPLKVKRLNTLENE
jgi:hypothetical protein